MKILYSEHAKKRMKQRGVTEIEIEHVLRHPSYIKKSFEGTREALGEINNRQIKIKFIEIESYIKIITVM